MAESRLKVILETSGTGQIKAAKRGVDQLKAAVKQLDAQVKRSIPLQVKFARSLKRTQIQSIRAAKGIRSAAQSLSSLQGVLGGLAIGAFFKSAIDEAVAYEAALSRIGRLEGQFKQLAGLQKIAAQSAEKLFISQTSAARAYADLGARLGPAISDVKELQAVYEGLEIVLLKNAKSTGEAASLQLQLNQALGKGTLNGDEFRSIAENAPEVLRQLATDAGISEQAIKDLATQGGITRDKLIKAFANLRNSGIEDFNALLETNLGKIRKYDKAVSDLRLTIGQDLLPAFTPLIEALTFVAKAFAALPEPVRKWILALTAVVAVVSLLAPLIAGLSLAVIVLGGKFVIAAGLVAALGLALFELPNILRQVAKEFAFVGDFIKDVWRELNIFVREFWRQTMADLLKVLKFFGFGSGEVYEDIGNAWQEMVKFMGKGFAGMLNKAGEDLKKFGLLFSTAIKNIPGPIGDLARFLGGLGSIELPTFDAGDGLGKLDLSFPDIGTLPESEDGEKGAAGRKKKLEDKQKELELNSKLLLQQDELRKETLRNFELENDYLKVRLEKGKEFADQYRDIRQLMVDLGISFKEAFDVISKNEGLKKAVSDAEKAEQKLKDLKQSFEDLKQDTLQSIGDTLQNGIVNAIEAAVSGTKDLGEALKEIASNILRDLGTQLIKSGLTGMFNSMGGGGDGGLGGLFGRLFKAEGGPVQSNQPYIVGEKGPELMVPSTAGTVMNNRDTMGFYGEGGSAPVYSPTINATMMSDGQAYVTVEQMNTAVSQGMRVAARQGAKAGEAMTFKTLQNSRSQRNRIGVGV